MIPSRERLSRSTRNLSPALSQEVIRWIGLAGSVVLAIKVFAFMFGLSLETHGRKELNLFHLKFPAHIGPRVEFLILSRKCRRAVKSANSSEILTLKEYEYCTLRTSTKSIKLFTSLCVALNWEASRVMTFMVNQQYKVHQKASGPRPLNSPDESKPTTGI